MLDVSIFNLIKECDFTARSPLSLRPYVWGSLEVYESEVQLRMSKYHSKYDLLHWLSFWTESKKLVSPFTELESYQSLRDLSRHQHQKVLKNIFNGENTQESLHNGYDIWNAIDGHVILKYCPNAKTILDFGSGYGRLGAVFSEENKDKIYISMDCIEISYILQNLFLSNLGNDNFYEYCDAMFQRQEFKINTAQTSAIYHIPSWRFDLIEDEQIDLIASVFVLPEINEFAILDFIHHASRVVRPNGYIYLRDHLYQTGEKNHKGGHNLNTEKLLEEAGFTLTYCGDYKDNLEIYGTPRIYQKKPK